METVTTKHHIDTDFLSYNVTALTGNPDCFTIDRTIDEKGVLLTVTIEKEYVGKILGKQGNTAKALRTLLHALGAQNDARYNLKIQDSEEAAQ